MAIGDCQLMNHKPYCRRYVYLSIRSLEIVVDLKQNSLLSLTYCQFVMLKKIQHQKQYHLDEHYKTTTNAEKITNQS